MTLEQVATAVGATRSQISRLENGNRRLTLEWMQKIAKVYSIPANALLESPEPFVRRRSEQKIPPGAISLTDVAGVTSPGLKVMEIRGDSNAPSLMPGDRVIIDEQDRTLAAGLYLVDYGSGPEIKRVSPTSKTVRLSTDNQAYASFDSDPRKLRILGRVVSRILRV